MRAASYHHLSAVDGPIYIKPVRGNLEFPLTFCHSVLVLFGLLIRALRRPYYRLHVMLYFTLSLYFHVPPATTLLFLTSTKANCSSALWLYSTPLSFYFFLSISFCPTIIMRTIFSVFLSCLCLLYIGCLSHAAL